MWTKQQSNDVVGYRGFSYTTLMIKRSVYALHMAWRHRRSLKAYQQDPVLQINTVLEIAPGVLKQQGIRAIALDFDGVLASYGEIEPSPDVIQFINSCVQVFGKSHIFILTNKPTPLRHSYFTQHFKAVTFVLSPQKKPYPEGIQQIVRLTQIKPHELMVIDDRLLTGILAAIIAGASGLYVTHPYISFRKRPIQELFFVCMRSFERWLIRLLPS